MDIRTVADFEARLAEGRYTSIGSYPVYFVTADGTALSFRNAKKHAGRIKRAIEKRGDDGWRVTAADVNWEDPEFYDGESGERIESAYAEDRAGAPRMNPRENPHQGKNGDMVTEAGRRLRGSAICPTREEAAHFLSVRKAAIHAMLRSLTPAQLRKYRQMIPSEQNKFETKHGVPARIGRCTFQSASLVMHYGGGTWFARPEKPERLPEEKPEPSEKPRDWTNWWWKRFGFDSAREAEAAGHSASGRVASGRGAMKQLPAPQRSAAEELGLATDHKPTKAEVKAAFARRVLAAHPDRGGDAESFKRALAARDKLMASAA